MGGRRRASGPPAPATGLDPALLAAAVHELGGTLDLGRLMARLTDLARQHLRADGAGVWLLERRDTEVMLYGEVGLRRGLDVAHLPHSPAREILG